MLDSLIDEVHGENENHPLASLMESIGNLVKIYENNNFPKIYGTPEEALRYLMNEHNLKQSDLPEIGSEKVVSEILKGKRSLTVRQVKELSARFNVSPLVFILEGTVFHELARHKESTTEQGVCCSDHVHMLISIPPKFAVSSVIGYNIKGKNAIHVVRHFFWKMREITLDNPSGRAFFFEPISKRTKKND